MKLEIIALAAALVVSGLFPRETLAQTPPPPSTPGTVYTTSYNADGSVASSSNPVPPAAIFSNATYAVSFAVQFPEPPNCSVSSTGGYGYAFFLTQGSLTTTGVTVAVNAMGGTMSAKTKAPFTLTCQ